MTSKKTPADPAPVPVPPLPVDVTSISWWVALVIWLANEALVVGVLVGHPLPDATVNGIVAIVVQVASVVAPVVAYLTHGKVKVAQIQASR